MVDSAGWLQAAAEGLPPVIKVPSTRVTQLDGQGPAGIVWHWTGGRCRSPEFAVATVNEIREYDKAKDRAASWHVLIARDGRVFQSIPFTKGSWHVGRPGRIGAPPTVGPDGKWDATAWAGGRLVANVNKVTVGVELENAGRLVQVAGKFYCWPFYSNPTAVVALRLPDPRLELDASRAIKVGDAFFDDFPADQQQAAGRLVQALHLKYGLIRDVCRYGHVMFDQGRKEDPGSRWLDQLLPAILDGAFGGP
jgi:N-acetyl-anhydromuramyl-L-alanine amidase AmpD